MDHPPPPPPHTHTHNLQQYSLAGQSDPAHSSDATFALSLYYDEDSFEELCSAGPNGLAMYFYPDLASSRDGAVYQDCSSAEENGSGEGTATMATGPLNAAHLSEKYETYNYYAKFR